MEFSMVFIMSNAHHTFGDKIGFVMILDTFRASVGEPFGSFGVLLGTFLKCCFLPLLRGTGYQRVSAGISEYQRVTARAGVWGP